LGNPALDVVGIFCNKCCGSSNTVELYDVCKFFYSSAQLTQSTQAGVGILINPQFAGYVNGSHWEEECAC